MGFESHVDRELQRSASGLVRGEDYWFYDGLRTETIEVAEKIVQLLDESGEFGPACITDWSEHDRADMGGFTIEFGIFEQWFDGTPEEYKKYVDDFKAGGPKY